MPELPDVTVYVEALVRHVGGQRLMRVRLKSSFLVRTFDPPLAAAEGRTVRTVERLGKRLVLGLDDELFLVLHLMVAGRLRWRKAGAGLPGKAGLAAFDFEGGTLVLTEAGTKRRASLHVVQGRAALAAHDRGGIDVMTCDAIAFAARLRQATHTLKRALCDPATCDGIGNAYSDEILFHARLSPLQRTTNLDDAEMERLWRCARATLTDWTARLRADVGEGFPDKVTAFHAAMAVHGRHRAPCPDCGAPVQRIVYADNETNYCAACQTGGRLLRDRALSLLLKDDWPRSLDELD